jgi:GT2 family glycosyltransferase
MKNYLKSCLGSLLAQSKPPLEVIVIDNAPGSDYSQGISGQYPLVRIIKNPENLFYTGGMNKGIASSKGEFILCLNDDTVLDQDFICQALKGFSVARNIGMVSGKILRQDKKTLDSTGLFLSPWRTARERGYGQLDSGQFQKSGFVFGVSGAAAFYRRQMLEEIKESGDYFDSRFKMFYEDLDLCWRANNRGWRGYYIPSALIYHVRGGSFRPDSGIDKPIGRKYLDDRLHCGLIKNRYLTILKNERFPGFCLCFIPIFIYDICAWCYILFFHRKVIKLLLVQISNCRKQS